MYIKSSKEVIFWSKWDISFVICKIRRFRSKMGIQKFLNWLVLVEIEACWSKIGKLDISVEYELVGSKNLKTDSFDRKWVRLIKKSENGPFGSKMGHLAREI